MEQKKCLGQNYEWAEQHGIVVQWCVDMHSRRPVCITTLHKSAYSTLVCDIEGWYICTHLVHMYDLLKVIILHCLLLAYTCTPVKMVQHCWSMWWLVNRMGQPLVYVDECWLYRPLPALSALKSKIAVYSGICFQH